MKGKLFKTIYLGGGTPSVLTIVEIRKILDCIYKNYQITENPEITLEANPDDLTIDYLKALIYETPVNRLSIGIQSFIDQHLIWMNRRHVADEAEKCILNAMKVGFNNINADLIYGIPLMTTDQWVYNLQKLIGLNIQHISAYHLTIEPNTVFGRRQKKGFIKETEEELSYQQFEILLQFMKSNAFEQYDISNFAKKGYNSQHNLNYWKLGEYIGLGPSAHSFDGLSRQWNININARYINGINTHEGYYVKEILNEQQLFNEYIMLSFRTKWGVDLKWVETKFGGNKAFYLSEKSKKYISSGHMFQKEKNLILTDSGKFISDHIIADFFIE